MTDQGWSAWIAENTQAETSAQKLSRQAWQGAARLERAEAIADAEQAAEAEDRRDQRLLRFHQAGITAKTPGEVFDAGSRELDEAAEYEDCAARMAVIDRRRERRAALAADHLAAMQQRSDAQGDSLEQASRAAHRAFAEHTRAMLAEASVAPRSESRPFAGPGGATAGPEPGCGECRRQGFDAATSLRIHQAEAERAAPTGRREITRVCTPTGNVAWSS